MSFITCLNGSPFTDGNGRVGRLWRTLLLSRWNPAFAWLPVESIIHDHQLEYYGAINASNNAGKSAAFIEFMLSTILTAITEAISVSVAHSSKEELRWYQIEAYLKERDFI